LQGRLDERKEVWGLFPTAWRVPQVLCLTFCKITKVRHQALEGTGCSMLAHSGSSCYQLAWLLVGQSRTTLCNLP